MKLDRSSLEITAYIKSKRHIKYGCKYDEINFLYIYLYKFQKQDWVRSYQSLFKKDIDQIYSGIKKIVIKYIINEPTIYLIL